MRAIDTHKVNGLNENLLVNVLDDPGQGGACHEYQIRRWETDAQGEHHDEELCHVKFQKGPIGEAGVNGVSNEALLAILIDRMTGFANGPFNCHENDMALDGLKCAAMWMSERTKGRVARGVEGTMNP